MTLVALALPSVALADSARNDTSRTGVRAAAPPLDPLPAASARRGADVPHLRTRTSRTYEARDGSYETRLSPESINYQDDLDRWQPIDNRLRIDGDVVRNGANRYVFTAPRRLTDNAQIKVGADSSWVAFAPSGARGTARVDGSSVTYANAWPGVDLRYTATGDAVREEMVVRDRASARDFHFGLRLPAGTVAQEAGDGVTQLRDATGAKRMRLSSAWMVDAAGARAPVTSKLTRGVGGWSMRISPDRGWLAAHERKWPVRVDPTVVVGETLGCTIAWDELREDEESYCGEGLVVGEVCQDVCKYYRTLLRFDLGSLPPGAYIEAATLTGVDDIDEIGRLTKAWTNDVTWDTTDGSTEWTWPTLGGYFGGAGNDQVPIPDLTQLTRDWQSGAVANHGFFFAEALASRQDPLVEIDPVLSIQYAQTEDPDSAAQGNSLEDYTEDAGISAAEAARRLQLQDRFGSLNGAIEDAIDPADFGGTWFDDNDDGRFKIAIKTNQPSPPNAKIEDAEDLLADHDLLSEADFVAVEFNEAELDDAQDDVSAALSTLTDAGKVTVSADVELNGLLVEEATTITPTEHGQVTTAAGTVDPPTTIVAVDETDLRMEAREELDPCGLAPNGWLACPPPLRGGINLVSTGLDGCTAGFWAKDGSDEFIVTAGHCLGSVDTGWFTITAPTPEEASHPELLGQTSRVEWATNVKKDVGAIRVDGSDFENSAPGYIYVTANDESNTPHKENFEITRVARKRPPKGRRMCVTQAPPNPTANRHTVCGTVVNSNYEAKYDGHTVLHTVVVRTCKRSDESDREVKQQYVEGGSGGPVYRNHTAYGIGVAGRWCRMAFVSAGQLQTDLDLEIQTR
ncbi:hypothetical protein C8N24_3385 [Solirubrobacter pauli]|uniref:Trypsin n=1 Tax=Solirubrobacter pauli TaxID=166793 RepID=A0A660LEI4_9ACTN|nr:DNRLRE domain-containing protein [Solirubrobacter pauli]RKQ93517.1 hypothetical protein C8N24_3385 [Solirubrobacter pauli]